MQEIGWHILHLKRIVVAELVTLAAVLWVHQIPTIGGRVPLVFVVLWFGSSTVVAMIFAVGTPEPASGMLTPDPVRRVQWASTMRVAVISLLPLSVIPLLEVRGVGGDVAIWLLDCALIIALLTVPYFTLVSRTALGGAVLSVGAFQALWTGGASVAFRIMEKSVQAQGGHIAPGAAFEEFFRRPEYRHLFYGNCAAMLLGYCPAILWLGYRRFTRPVVPPDGSRLRRDGSRRVGGGAPEMPPTR